MLENIFEICLNLIFKENLGIFMVTGISGDVC